MNSALLKDYANPVAEVAVPPAGASGLTAPDAHDSAGTRVPPLLLHLAVVRWGQGGWPFLKTEKLAFSAHSFRVALYPVAR